MLNFVSGRGFIIAWHVRKVLRYIREGFMKYKYRLILRGDNRYTHEYKPKGFFSFLDNWMSSGRSFATEQEAIEAMNEEIADDNNSHMRKFKKVIKVIEND
jgi:hypothetical protein